MRKCKQFSTSFESKSNKNENELTVGTPKAKGDSDGLRVGSFVGVACAEERKKLNESTRIFESFKEPNI